MRNPKNDFGEQIKREANQSIFQNMDFNEEMKEKVRARVNTNKRKKVSMMFNWYRYTAIATIALGVFVTLFTLFIHDGGRDIAEQGASEFSTFSSKDKISNPIAGRNEIKIWEVKSQDEIKQLFPNVMLPTYIADSYQQESIKLFGDSKDNLQRVLFTYVHEGKSYIVTIEQNVNQLKPVGFKNININGINGYLNEENVGSENNITDLRFYTESYQYMINGMISSDEAIKVARSFKE